MMLLERSKSESNIAPNDLEVKKLGGNYYEIVKNDNVVTFEKDHEGQVETMYQCDKVILQKHIKSREEAVIAFIRLKYSQDDEFALTNKGIANANDEKYIAYRNYVVWCKEQATIYF